MPTTNLLDYARLEMNPDSQRVNVSYDEMIHVDDGFMDEELSFYFDSFTTSSSTSSTTSSSSLIRRTTPGRKSKLAAVHSTPPPPTRRRKRSGGGRSGGSIISLKSESRWCCEETSCLSPGLKRPQRRPAITTTTTDMTVVHEPMMVLRSPIGRKQTPKQLQRKSLISQPTTRRNSFVKRPPTSPTYKNTKNQNAVVHLSDAAKRTFVIPRMNSRSPAQDIVHRKRIIQ